MLGPKVFGPSIFVLRAVRLSAPQVERRLDLVQGAPAMNMFDHAGVSPIGVARFYGSNEITVCQIKLADHIIAVEHASPNI